MFRAVFSLSQGRSGKTEKGFLLKLFLQLQRIPLMLIILEYFVRNYARQCNEEVHRGKR